MPNFSSYPTPILTFVAFFIFASLVVWKDCLGAYLVARQRWEHPYAEWLRLFLQCFSRIATVKLLCWDTGLPPRGSILHLRGLRVATVAFTSDALLQESFFGWFSFIFATQWRLEELFR